MRPTATGLPDIGITPVSWDFEAEQERLMRAAIGNEWYDKLEEKVNLDPDEEFFTDRNKCEPIWHWAPVSRLVKWIGDQPIFETPSLDDLTPDYGIQRAAAVEYLNRNKESEPVKMNIPAFIPIAIALIVFALFGLTVGWSWIR